jgi:hypothetical protein
MPRGLKQCLDVDSDADPSHGDHDPRRLVEEPVPIRLSNKDLAALTRASTILVNPFSYEDEDAWQRAACSAVQALVDADASSSTVPLAGKPVLGGEPEIIRVLEVIFPPPEWVSDALIVQRNRQMNVADWSDVFDVHRVRRSAFYNDVVRPHRLLAQFT